MNLKEFGKKLAHVLPVGVWFDFPVTFLADLKGVVGDVFSDIGLLLAIIIGLPLAFWVVRRVVGLVRVR